MASVYPLAKLVSAPDPSATALYDFNVEDGTAPLQRCRVEHDGFSLGTPALQGDPDSIFPQYGPRTVSFTVQIRGPKSYALGKVSAAARWLLRDNSWLMVQLSSTMKPVWFKLYRPEPGDLSFDHVDKTDTKDVWRWSLQLPAEAFAYGQRVTIPTATINNDPAATTNPCSLVLPTILGDAPAPVRIQAAFGMSIDQHDILWNITAVNAANQFPITWPIGTGDGWTAGVDTGAGVSSTAFSGGSYREVSFSTTPGMALRVGGFTPVIPYTGRYSIYLRCARSDTASTFQMQLGRGRIDGSYVYAGSPVARMDRATSATAGHASYVWLGDFSIPEGASIGSNVGLPPVGHFGLQAARLSGTGALRMDAFYLVPSDILPPFGMGSETMVSEFAGYGPPSNDLGSYWDGDGEFYTRVNAFAVTDPRVQTNIRGSFPMVRPGLTNVLHLLTQVRTGSGTVAGTTDSSDSITSSTQVTVSYQPRWLFIGDGS